MSDVQHTETVRQALEDSGVRVNDIELRGMESPAPTRIIIDGHLSGDYEPHRQAHAEPAHAPEGESE